MNQTLPAAALLWSFCLATAAVAASAPPVGAYSCYDAKMSFSPIQGNHLEITPMPFVMFGLVDGSTYADWDGHSGHYTYDASQGLLTMTDGSREGWRYKKTAEWSFSLIDNHTGGNVYTCPFETTANPSHGPW